MRCKTLRIFALPDALLLAIDSQYYKHNKTNKYKTNKYKTNKNILIYT